MRPSMPSQPGNADLQLSQRCTYNEVQLLDIVLAADDEKGNHFKPTRNLRNDDDNVELPLLLTIPKDMVLSDEAIQQYAKMDKNFRDIFHAAGHQAVTSSRYPFVPTTTIHLFLTRFQSAKGWSITLDLVLRHATKPGTGAHDVDEDPDILLTWNLARGKCTYRLYCLLYLRSLEDVSDPVQAAVPAKIAALTKEFDHVRDKCEHIPFWREYLHEDEVITVDDWLHLDALYRSRSLELPKSGECMVPVLDMVNHSPEANAYFDETADGDVRLLIREGCFIKTPTLEGPDRDEITINYGKDKSAAEMLFSYGFVDSGSPAKSLALPLAVMEDDPLAKAKLHVFGSAPNLKIEDTETGVPQWTAPFVYLMCLNEDDGIEFRVIQTVEGSRQLMLFWQEDDVTGGAGDFERLIAGHDLEPIFHLRAITVIFSQLEGHIEGLETPLDRSGERSDPGFLFPTEGVSQLRKAELDLMQRTLQALESQVRSRPRSQTRTHCRLGDKVAGLHRVTCIRVRAYLGSMEEPQNEEEVAQPSNREEDFS
ncbi:SET domain-containing protein [Seiridium cupressi]